MPRDNTYTFIERRRSKTLTQLVKAFCLDYMARKTHIMKKDTSRRVRMEYEYINSRIFDGAAEIVGSELAESFIEDIGNSRGYGGSNLIFYSERNYKVLKGEVMDNIARSLHLLD